MNNPLPAQISADPEDSAGDADDGAGEPPSPCHIELTLMAPDTDPPVDGWIQPQLGRIAELAGADRGRLGLALVGDDQMSKLHEQYKGEPVTTDVLSFDLREDDQSALDGDVVVSVDVASRQAAPRGHDTRLEVLLYAVHGLLHLLGEDDADPRQAAAMHRRENELLVACGFDPLYGTID